MKCHLKLKTQYIFTQAKICVWASVLDLIMVYLKVKHVILFHLACVSFFCFSLIFLLLICMCKMNINRMDLKQNSWRALECLRNWWRCGFSFTSEFIRVAFATCWMKWIPSANRWRQSRCGQIFPVSRMDTTFDAKKNRVTHTFW